MVNKRSRVGGGRDVGYPVQRDEGQGVQIVVSMATRGGARSPQPEEPGLVCTESSLT